MTRDADPQMPELPLGLSALREQYDAVLCDLWGVVHNGQRPFERAVRALQAFRASGGRVILLTNVPKPRTPIPRQLDRIGVARDAWDVIVTSGDAIRSELAVRAPGPMHLIGPVSDSVLWEGLGMELAPLERAHFVCATGLDDFEDEHPELYAPRLRLARARGLDFVCANPDIVVRLGDRLHWCAGVLARDYDALGGRVIMAGKPHAPIYALALRELASLLDRPVDRARVLAIGDGPGTDILGANREGIDALFVSSGIHEGELHHESGLDLAKVHATLRAANVSARYALPELC